MDFWTTCRNRNGRRGAKDQWKCTDRAWIPGLLAGALFLWAGAARGELADIWRKAVMICMECIGIG